ncbi:MAG: PAS domain S-box protein [Gemmatimonadaceae bacterium]|nr:PAS domain S-box protein [Gemmatimonadaceae bacterium]
MRQEPPLSTAAPPAPESATTTQVERGLRRHARVLAIGTALASTAAVLAWPAGLGELLTFGASQVPTAPGTGVIGLLLSVALLIRAGRAVDDRDSAGYGALVGGALAFAIACVWAQLNGYDLALESWLAGTTEVRDGIAIGRVSRYTAGLYVLLAGTLLMRRSPGRRQAEAIALTLVVGACVLLIQGYLLGAPLMYGGHGIIPVAAPTALLIFAIAIAALLLTGPDIWPIRLFLPAKQLGVLPTRGGFAWLALLLSALVVSSGFFWYSGERRRSEERTAATLEAIGDLKARELTHWYASHRTTATALSRAPLRTAELLQDASPAASPGRREAVRRWLTHILEDNDYESVTLFAADGREVLRVAVDGNRGGSAALGRRVRALPATDTLIIDGLQNLDGLPQMTIWAPIAQDARAGLRAPGAWLALLIHADDGLDQIVTEPPAHYRTGEFLLWRQDGDSLRIVSKPRSDPGARFRAVHIDTDTSLVVSATLRAGPGIFAGNDYRGVPVRANVRRVAGTPWILSSKVDASEIRVPVLTAALRATSFTLIFLLGTAAVVYAMWYRRDLVRSNLELDLIAAREASMADVRSSEERYARAMRGTTDGLWELDLVTGLAYVSDRWRAIVGIGPEVPVNTEDEFLELIHPDDVPRQREAVRNNIDAGIPYDIELRLRDESQGPRWIRTRADIQRDADGRPLRMTGAITDITRSVLAEQALHRADRVLRVRSAINQAIVRAEQEPELLEVACESLVREGGYRMAWIGERPRDTAGGGRQMATAGDERGSQSSVSIPLQVGNDVIGALTIYAGEPDAFDAEELTLLEALARDLSFGIAVLRNRATMARQREQLLLFRQTIERHSDAIFIADLATGRFVDFNEAALQQLGYTADEMRKIGPSDVVVDFGSRGGFRAVATNIKAAGGIVRNTLHRRKDGSEIPVEVALSLIESGGRQLVLGIARDVSDRLRFDSEREDLQQQLTRAQKMESVGRLAGGVAHDFNNLLTVITATTDLALAETADDTAQRHDLLEIRSAAERAAALTRQLLAFSRQQVLKREVLDLNDVVSTFLKMLSRVIGEDVRVELKLGRDVPSIIADAGQLEQVLMNLCVNARDAMPAGGTLIIGTGIADVDGEHAARREGMSKGTYAVLSVSDTGVGMDKATQAKIFDPFFTTKAVGRGTGLGLSTVYGIVKQSGGSVWVYSEPGHGTTFRIYLPITAEAPPEVTSASSGRARRGEETILVVEDEESIRLVARRVLEREGYTVLEAASGPDALSLLERHTGPLHLVMTDLVMPGMTGIELAQRLAATHPALKMLFTSGYSADVVSDRFRPQDDWNFIAKPYGVRELAAEVRRVLDV